MQQRKVTQTNALFQECFCLGDRAARIMGMIQAIQLVKPHLGDTRPMTQDHPKFSHTHVKRHQPLL